MKCLIYLAFLLSLTGRNLGARESIGVILWRQNHGDYRAHIQHEDGHLEPIRTGDSRGRIERFPGADSLDNFLHRHGWEYSSTRNEMHGLIKMRLYER